MATRSVNEEHCQNSASAHRKGMLFQVRGHLISFQKKRTLSTECYELYHQHFGS